MRQDLELLGVERGGQGVPSPLPTGLCHLTVLFGPFSETRRVRSGQLHPRTNKLHDSSLMLLRSLAAPFQAPLASVPAVTEVTAIAAMMTKNNMKNEKRI